MSAAPAPLPGRDCGGCTVCCVELAIDDPELVKPDEVPCPHLAAQGCGCAIYARRPRTCAGWFCGWRLISLSETMRPDRSGVLLVPEIGDQPGYQKGGLKLVGVGGNTEALLQDEIVDLAGRCVARGVPIFLSYGPGAHCKRTLINPDAEPVVRRGDRAGFVRLLTETLRAMRDAVAAEMAAGGGAEMAREYSLAHLTVLGCPPPQAIEIAARCGYTYVGLRTLPLGLPGEPRYVLEDDRALFAATRAALTDTGVRLLDIEVAVIREERRVADYRPALELAAELGARHVLCNAWSGTPAFIQDEFEALCDLAAPLGLSVQCEFVTFTAIVGLADAWRIVQASGRANAGVLIDTLHFARSHVALADIDAVPDERFQYLQLCDAPFALAPTVEALKATARGGRLYVGEGVAPIREIVRRLPGRPLSLEIIHAERVAALGYEAFARTCLERAKAHLGED